jgi:hypothetical protein
MTTSGTPTSSDQPAPDPAATYDLIICHDDRMVFHDHYESPEHRLRMCVGLLTDSDVVSRIVDSTRSAEIRALYQAYVSQWTTAPDSVVDAIAKLCRQWGVQVYASTTTKKSSAPATLFSVVTEYGPGQTVAEHFPSREARHASLVERVDQFFDAPGCIPHSVAADEERLVVMLAMHLMSATVTLTESSLDKADGVYRPSGHPLQID